ncbi:MAG TPA: methyltransferase domain-containing protein [Gemmataceae bacterium]
MPRPCLQDHPSSPSTCRVCFWCADVSEMGSFYRRHWGEPEPDGRLGGALGHPPREMVSGLLDPIPEAEFAPLPPGWAHDARVIRRHRDALLALAKMALPPPGSREDAGIVVIGGGRYWPGIVVSLKMLRDTGCRLPVQIWHRGAAEPIRRQDLDGIEGVEIHDLTTLTPPPRILRGWDAKTVALLACGWERVFFLDADAYFLRDPTPILERLSAEEPFLYWNDLPAAWTHVAWSVWGQGSSSVPPIQGGHFAIHMRHFWREFVLTYWLDQHSDFSYVHQLGDQDSWRVALTVTGGRYQCLGPARWEDVAYVCDLYGVPFIVHRSSSKMLYPEDVTPGDWASNRRLDRLPGEARAWAYWEELRSSRSAPDVFGRIYASGLWGPCQSSGDGSNASQAWPYLDIINGLTKVSGWKRVIDLGCGDGYITSRLQAPEVVGVDCHAPYIRRLREEAPGMQWLSQDLDHDRERLPPGDAALLKDVLHHWPNRLVRDWLTWARQCGKWRWVICSQDRAQQADGQDCPLGGYRGLDLSMEPLRGLGLVPLCDYLHKSVLLLEPSAAT